MNKLNFVFKISEIAALLAIAFVATWGGFALRQATATLKQVDSSATSIQKLANSLPAALTSEADKQAAMAYSHLDNQANLLRRDANKQLSDASHGLLAQTAALVAHTDTVLDSTNESVRSASILLGSANTVVANPDIPKLVRDARMTLAISGTAASHIEGMANAWAQAAPDILKNFDSITSDWSGISKDVHGYIKDLTKPQPWWHRALDVAYPIVRIGGAVLEPRVAIIHPHVKIRSYYGK